MPSSSKPPRLVKASDALAQVRLRSQFRDSEVVDPLDQQSDEVVIIAHATHLIHKRAPRDEAEARKMFAELFGD